ncbi:hypothetical protein HTS88_14635 [Pseudarthrobacter oxydans]|uniref:ABC-three component system protein n=1 Tax=Pseudarthrobacter oxydans TaxID=1671 RepID=UPI0015739631|nr:ABC-three component system protein [Pseudarthrobacter oxydans]NSX37626.1 hypothetical protein [Pseudarthrobacter oxydans]
MKWYDYEDMSPTGFENLVIAICQRLLGYGVIGFAPGPDGGRDAKFHGTADLHPSARSPWSGKTIVQAKHTNGNNKYFSEPDFFSASGQSATLTEEVVRVSKLIESGNLDNYMVFANRILSGNAESEIRTYISLKTGLAEESIYLCGRDQLDMHLKTWPDVARVGEIAALDAPLLVDSNELAEIIEALHGDLPPAALAAVDDIPVDRVSYAEKNRLNRLTDSYAKDRRRRYLADCFRIQEFLESPDNADVMRLYESVVDEFQARILSKRSLFENFDDVLEYLLELLFSRNPLLRRFKRLTRVIVFYMYWHCDIGETSDAEAD